MFYFFTREEFVKTYASGNLNSRKFHPASDLPVARREIRLEDLPAEVDWRKQGVITSVRDQGMCGSCWAFAAASTMASYAKIGNMSHDLVELSPQHLVSCAPNTLHCGGTGGCMGSQLLRGVCRLMSDVQAPCVPWPLPTPPYSDWWRRTTIPTPAGTPGARGTTRSVTLTPGLLTPPSL